MVKEIQSVINFLQENGFSNDEVQQLENFASRDSFQVINNDDLEKMLHFFNQYPADFEDLTPIMTDNNSNYICVYYKGENVGKVCYLSHDEIDLYPRFSSIQSLIQSIQVHPLAKDFEDLPNDAFDY